MVDSKQQQIMEAAKDLFGERGYEATSVRDIAELAGTNAASINYYFGSKEELFKTIVRLAVKDTPRIMSVVSETPENIDELKMMLKNFLKLFCHLRVEDPKKFSFMNRNMDLFLELEPETFKRDVWAVKESLKELLVKAQKGNLLKKDLEPDMLAIMVFSVLGHLIRD